MKSLIAPTAPWRAAALALTLGLSFTTAHIAYGQATANPPERMTYQGFLVDGNGAPLGNSAPKNYDVIFRIWSSENGSSAPEKLWAEQQTVTVDKGNFSVLLGEGTEISGESRPGLSTLFKGATASDRWVSITVKGIGPGGSNADILPRMRLLPSPYAYLATQATKLVRSDNSNDLLTTTGDTMQFNGQLDVLNNNSLEFGVGLTKQSDAGKFGYQLFTADALDIVGAGTTGANRKVKIWAEGGLTVAGPVTATSFNGLYNGDGSNLAGVAKLGANTFTGYQEVQNHFRVGELASAVGGAGWGEALIFSGAPQLSFGNSDNSDPLWMARYNAAGNASELRTVIGDDPGSREDQFVIGTMAGNGNFAQNATWGPLFTFRANGLLEFKPGVTKEISAGTIGYQVHSTDSLDIVGAGTTGSNRKVQIWSEAGLQLNGGMNMTGPLNVNTYNGTTFRVTGNVFQVFEATDKAKYFQMFRYANGVAIQGGGGGWGNASGDFRQITWDGDGNWDAASDRKLKKDIVDAEPLLDRTMKVQVRRFHWIDDNPEAKMSLGVIAQELQPLFPDLIAEQENPTTKEKNLAVGYSDFGLIAVKALQELKTQHDAEVKDLKAEIADLRAQMKQVLQAATELKVQSDKSKQTAAVTK